MIELKNISKHYKTGQVATQALQDVSLDIQQGNFLSIRGKSGCGKTTLLNIIGCMDRATGGRYLFQGKDISTMSVKDTARFRNKNIGYVFQAFNLVDEMNAWENVSMPLGYSGINTKLRKQIAQEMLQKVGLGNKMNHRPSQLSGGEQQRVAVARAIANSPEILIADEPTGNLDEKNGHEIMSIISELHSQGTTIVLVTHDEEISQYAHQCIHLQDGKLIK